MIKMKKVRVLKPFDDGIKLREKGDIIEIPENIYSRLASFGKVTSDLKIKEEAEKKEAEKPTTKRKRK